MRECARFTPHNNNVCRRALARAFPPPCQTTWQQSCDVTLGFPLTGRRLESFVVGLRLRFLKAAYGICTTYLDPARRLTDPFVELKRRTSRITLRLNALRERRSHLISANRTANTYYASAARLPAVLDWWGRFTGCSSIAQLQPGCFEPVCRLALRGAAVVTGTQTANCF